MNRLFFKFNAEKWCLFFLLIGQLIVFNVEAAGSFQPVTGSPFSTEPGPQSIAFSPIHNEKTFVGVANYGSSQVSAYSIDPASGTLSQVPGSPYSSLQSTTAIAYSPIVTVEGVNYLYAAVATAQTILVYSIDLETGVLTQISSFSPQSTQGFATDIAFSSLFNGNLYAAITTGSCSGLEIYQVDLKTGAFTFLDSYATGVGSSAVAFSPIMNGYLYLAVTNTTFNTVSVYSFSPYPYFFPTINLVRNSTLVVSPSGGASGIAYSPIVTENGIDYVYAAVVLNSSSSGIYVYKVDLATGRFILIEGSPFSTGPSSAFNSAKIGIAFSPFVHGNLFVAAPNFSSNQVFAYQVNLSTGILTPVSGSPFPTGTAPIDVTYSPVINANGTDYVYVAVANYHGPSISVYHLDLSVHPNSPQDASITQIKKMDGQVVSTRRKQLNCPQARGHFVKYVNIIKWNAPNESLDRPHIVDYLIFRDQNLKDPIGKISNKGKRHFKFRIPNVNPHRTYRYSIVSEDALGVTSVPAIVEIKGLPK